LVAARFNISGSALRDANPGKELVAGAEIVVPRAGRIIGGAEVTPAGQAAAIYDPLAPREAAPKETASYPPAPKAELVQDMDAKSSVPDVIPPPADETPRTVVQNGEDESGQVRRYQSGTGFHEERAQSGACHREAPLKSRRAIHEVQKGRNSGTVRRPACACGDEGRHRLQRRQTLRIYRLGDRQSQRHRQRLPHSTRSAAQDSG
jgi:hypothetical protein